MDREAALDRLGGAYAQALRLADEGKETQAIAEELGIDAASVPLLVEIGRQKLSRLMAEDQ